ncbi:hypothetical protein FD755_013765 [Muntiacus reevesi]|uniref:Leucine rich repeat containing 49 n=1 Tax=Muntiacus reevesi TaxID=9886 RepID=A0A5N3XQE4_MUNRE|nr:hypothetical protein FD755_013765 [Muntiacus reevesi]
MRCNLHVIKYTHFKSSSHSPHQLSRSSQSTELSSLLFSTSVPLFLFSSLNNVKEISLPYVSVLKLLRAFYLTLAITNMHMKKCQHLCPLGVALVNSTPCRQIFSVCCLADSTSLSDITFDGNPIAQESWYKHTILQNMTQLRQLDMKRITVSENPSQVLAMSLDSGLTSALQGLSVTDTHLVEVDGDTLSLYGSGALECLDRNWSVQTAGMVTTVSFTFIEFDEIVQVLPKLKIKFPNSLHLKFKETNLVMLQQFNALAQLRRVDQLTIDPQGNPVVSFTLWKYYVLFRLSHFNMQKINGTEVTQNDMIMAERLFGILAHVASSELPQYRLISILGDTRKKQFRYLLETKGKKPGIVSEENNDSKRLVGENTNRATLNYTTRDFYTEKLEEIKEKKKFCKMYIEDLVKEATEINMKNEALQKLWPQMFIELVRDAVIEIRNKNSYMKLCLQQITDQK